MSITSRAGPGLPPADQARRRASPTTASSWRTWPKVKARRKVPKVEGAITRKGSTCAVPPQRKMSAWSMWLAPATMACTRVNTLRPGRAPPTRPGRRTVAFTSRSSSRRTTSVPTSSSPALATRFGSSKLTRTRSMACDTRLTESASRSGGLGDVRHRHRRCSGGTFRGWSAASGQVNRWIEAKEPSQLPAPCGGCGSAGRGRAARTPRRHGRRVPRHPSRRRRVPRRTRPPRAWSVHHFRGRCR